MATKKAVVKKEVKKGQTKTQAAPAKKTKEIKETKETKLVKLLSGKESYTVEEIMKKTGFSAASANMYLSQSYLDRKNKPYKIVKGTKGDKPTFRYVVAKGKKK